MVPKLCAAVPWVLLELTEVTLDVLNFRGKQQKWYFLGILT